MSDWNEIKRPFRDALIDAFNWHGLAIVLTYHCDRRLDRITSENEGFDKNVDDVIVDAVQTGWLENLAKGALAENEKHTGLQATVPLILQGVEREGKAYYQKTVDVPVFEPRSRARPQLEPTRQLRKVLDAAIQSEVSIGEETILLVLIRDQDSRGLYAVLEIEPEYGLQDEDVRQSRPFKLYFPVDESGNLLPATVEVIVTSPGFDPPSQSRIIEVSPTVEDEEELYPEEFVLTPLRTGTLRIIIEVYQQPQERRTKIGSKPISTLGLESTSRYAKWKVQSILFGGQGAAWEAGGTPSDPPPPVINIEIGHMEGAIVTGTVDTGGGDFAGRDVDKSSETIGGVSLDDLKDGPLGKEYHNGDVIEAGRKDDGPGKQELKPDAPDSTVPGDIILGDKITGSTGDTIGPGTPASITIGAMPAADDTEKRTLEHLVSQLDDLLIFTPDDQQADAAAVAQSTQLLLDALAADRPDPTVVQGRGSTLQQKAQAFEATLPQIVDLAEKIARAAAAIAMASG